MNTNVFENIYRSAEKRYRYYYPKQLKNRNIYSKSLKGLKGIEIGGPSNIFTKKGLVPIYDSIASLDGCNFSTNTVWEGELKEGLNFDYGGKKKGFQHIAEGSDLSKIKDNQYDFVLSCHNLEHLANPLKALLEWKRIIKDGGFLVIVLPHKDKTFDHRRPVTTLEHIISDYRQNTTEQDDTHFYETIELHDMQMDKGIQSKEELKERTFKNYFNRCMHHHVFNTFLVVQLMNEIDMQIISADVMYHNIFIIAQKATNKKIDNNFFTTKENRLYHNKLYPSDMVLNKTTAMPVSA
jgi:SAM-dependent methyltransferase